MKPDNCCWISTKFGLYELSAVKAGPVYMIDYKSTEVADLGWAHYTQSNSSIYITFLSLL